LKNGNKSIYLDIYRDGQRTYEFLKLYVVPVHSEQDKDKNRETLLLANKIKNRKILELDSTEHGFESKAGSEKQKTNLSDYINELAKNYKDGEKTSMYYSFRGLGKKLQEYKGNKITLKQLNKEYCKGFIEYLKKDKTISRGTAYQYSGLLNIVINRAMQDDILSNNPMRTISRGDKIKKAESNVEYLTIEELRQLSETPCISDTAKKAFLFSCFSGLRYSDIQALKWDDIKKDNNGEYYIKYQQEKTDKIENLQISKEAIKQLPERSENEQVFSLMQNGYLNKIIAGWALAAGITKKVTFHVARHTNATLLMSLGVEIETVSKILGHSDIKTTQIYAKVIDERKREAVRKLDDII
jgi:integrase